MKSRNRVLALAGSIAALALMSFPVAAHAGTVSANPPSSNFNTQPWYFGGQFINFQISNSGSDTTLGGATITGPDAGQFYVGGDTCVGATLGDGLSCGVGIGFNPPSGPGSFSAQVEIPSDGAPNPLVIPLDVEALAGPELVSSPSRVVFGPTILGAASSEVLTISNAGDFPGGIQQVFVVGPPEFEIEDDQCTLQELAPGEDCTMSAVFAPSVPGDYQGTVFAIVASGDTPVLPIGLSGKGRLAPGPVPDTRITRRPKGRSTSTIASFQFASGAGASFECKLDKEAFAPCSSPATYVVKRGKHTFQVRAVNADGADATPAKATFRVVKKRARPAKKK